MLVNLSASNPLTFTTAALLLGAVSLPASHVPARRAARVDPMLTLKNQ